MDNSSNQLIPAAAPAQPQVVYQHILYSVPTTNLLHFTLWWHVITSGLGVAIFLLNAISRSYETNIYGGLALMCGVGLWWWIHCLHSLQGLRQYADGLFHASLRK